MVRNLNRVGYKAINETINGLVTVLCEYYRRGLISINSILRGSKHSAAQDLLCAYFLITGKRTWY